jgi:nitrogen fixation NifU-like protein
MNDELQDLYQQVILDHNRSPRNFRKLDNANRTAEGHNPLCGDQIQVYLLMQGDTLKEISFQGSGCAISKASASLMTDVLKGKTNHEIQQLFQIFHDMVMTGKEAEIGKLSAFAGVHHFPARVKCAILPWHAIMAALENKKTLVSTE